MTMIDKDEARILAALSAAPHVNQTPKSEHDAGDVLTAHPPDVAGVVEATDFDKIAYAFWSIHPRDIPDPVGMPAGYKGGHRAWYYAQTMRQTFRDLISLATAQAAQIAELKRDKFAMRDERDKAKIAAETALADMTHERDFLLTTWAESRKRHLAAETALAAMTKERDDAIELIEAQAKDHASNNVRLAEMAHQVTAERDKTAKLVDAGKALQADMLERARIGTDAIHGEEYRIVNAGRTAWDDFCAAITEAHQ